ncbi:PilN domain-containing protein [Alteribacter natronophilus]|uniref:PilN domain-containing protein n=1 Tax=Alteribacter natronophilus TaxID=2583810 RepID=UPI00110F5F21|nr:hypothetical protein [Alteribacter natronophilus]TMW71593.1 hypothetical protein FGB90_11200 [Alteribacter natronophilus]
MPVEINLLPKREKKDRTLLYVTGGLAAVCLLAVAGTGFWGSAVERETLALEEELFERQVEAAEIRSEINELSDADQVTLAGMISEMNEKVQPGSTVLHEMVRLMPPEGYFVEYEYNFPFDVYIEAAFYEMADVAYYHRALEDSGLVSQVTLHEIAGEDMIPEEEEEDTDPGAGFGFQNQPAAGEAVYLPHYVASMTVTLDPAGVKALEEELAEDEAEGEEPASPGEEENGTDADLDLDLDLDLEIDTEGEGDSPSGGEDINNGLDDNGFDDDGFDDDGPNGSGDDEVDADIDFDADLDFDFEDDEIGGDE